MRATTKLVLWTAMLLCLAGIAFAQYGGPTMTWVVPAASAYVSGGSSLINISVGYPAKSNVTNVNITIGTTTVCNHYENNLTYYNCSWNTKAFGDDTARTLTAKAYNVSGDLLNTTTRSVTPDNTKPTCAVDVSSGNEYQYDRVWTITGVNASSATLWVGGTQYTDTKESAAGDSFTLTGKRVVTGSSLTVKARSNDGRNTTDCTYNYIQIVGDTSKEIIALAQSGQSETGTQQPVAAKSNLLYLALIGVAVYFVFFRNRGKKK